MVQIKHWSLQHSLEKECVKHKALFLLTCFELSKLLWQEKRTQAKY